MFNGFVQQTFSLWQRWHHSRSLENRSEGSCGRYGSECVVFLSHVQ